MENKELLYLAGGALLALGVHAIVMNKTLKRNSLSLGNQKEKSKKKLDLSCCGFDRPKNDAVSATVSYHRQHLFVCTGRDDWEEDLIADKSSQKPIDPTQQFFEDLRASLKGQKEKFKKNPVKLTACDEKTKGEGTDVLLFPKGIRYRNLQSSDIPRLLNDLEKEAIVSGLNAELIHKKYIFVCCHANRDMRCGLCGPVLVDDFNLELRRRKMTEKTISVCKCSHIGGHKFAGNVLVFGEGDWFGYVSPHHVDSILDYVLHASPVPSSATASTFSDASFSAITKYLYLKDLWRGRLGLMEDTQRSIVSSWGISLPPNKQ